METLTKNTETVSRMYEAFAKGNIPFILSQLAENAVFTIMGEKPNPIAGIYDGISAIPDFFRNMATNYVTEEFRMDYALEVDDRTVIARGYHGGSGLKTGKPFSSHWAMEWKFNSGGKATTLMNFYDTQSFANAV